MGWFDGWPFTNKQEQLRKEREFAKRVLPFGDMQKQRAYETLRPLVSDRVGREELLFAYISAKDSYTLYDEEDEAAFRALRAMGEKLLLSEAERRAILALVILDSALASLDDYPSAEQVRQRAALIDETK